VVFIESICTTAELIESNIHQTVSRSPEYSGMSTEEAMAEFSRRNKHYMSIYETVQESEDVSFLKVKVLGSLTRLRCSHLRLVLL